MAAARAWIELAGGLGREVERPGAGAQESPRKAQTQARGIRNVGMRRLGRGGEARDVAAGGEQIRLFDRHRLGGWRIPGALQFESCHPTPIAAETTDIVRG